MITVTNGQHTIEVPSGAVKQYVRMGFEVIGVKEPVSQPVVEKEEENFFEEEVKEEPNDLEEKPLSDWTQEELKAYAKDNGINIKGKKPNDVRELIREHLEK